MLLEDMDKINKDLVFDLLIRYFKSVEEFNLVRFPWNKSSLIITHVNKYLDSDGLKIVTRWILAKLSISTMVWCF